MWTLDARAELTDAGRAALSAERYRRSEAGYKPTPRGRSAVRDLVQARAAIELLPVALNAGFQYVSPMDALFPEEASRASTVYLTIVTTPTETGAQACQDRHCQGDRD